MADNSRASNLENNIREVDAEYKKVVEEAAKNDSNFDIPNSTIGHAVFLSNTLISKAQDNIKILTGELSSPYYDRVKDTLATTAERFKKENKGEQIHIIIWERDARRNEGFEELITKYRDVIKMKNAGQPFSDKINHFLVSDFKRYRLENPHTKAALESGQITATANFGNPAGAKNLNDMFDRLWDKLPA